MPGSKSRAIFSFVAILSLTETLLTGTIALKAATALSATRSPKRRHEHNVRRRYVYAPFPVDCVGAIPCSPITRRLSTWSLNMATSSSDLKNGQKKTKTPHAAVADEGVNKHQNHKDHNLEEKNKKHVNKFKGIGNNVVSRLARAAKEAAEAKKKKKATAASTDNEEEPMSLRASNSRRDNRKLIFDDESEIFEDDEDSIVNQNDLMSITKLNNIIDKELLRPHDGYKPSRETDSIRLLLEHNNNQKIEKDRSTLNKSIVSSSPTSPSSKLRKKKMNGKRNDNVLTHNDVAIIFARPLSQNLLTIEYAVRLVSLAKAMKFEGYKPNVICFCGPASSSTSATTDTSAPKRDSVTSVGVDFFKRLCSANRISLDDTDLCRIPDLSSKKRARMRNNSQQFIKENYHGGYFSTTSNQDTPSFSISSVWSPYLLEPVVKELLDKKYVERWLDESQVFESDTDEYGMTRQEPRKKIHIHWKLFSAEYHLCNLNDIHIRSPRQSPLTRLVNDLEHAASNERNRRGIIQTTWSFHYSIYPYVLSQSKEKMKEAFLGKCYLMAKSLVPLLVNLKGVAENSEFFQRDNYRTLVATRRSLATLLEQMNEAYLDNRERQTDTLVIPPTLKAQLKKQTSGSSSAISSVEIHLECALLSLGRCCDLVRPAGTFSDRSVSRQEWRDALQHLQDFINRIECSCDPDRPVSADQWGGKLDENRSVVEYL